MLTADEVKERIESGVLPVRCIVDADEYNQRVYARFYADDGTVIIDKMLLYQEATDERALDEFVRSVREFLVTKGHLSA